MGAGRPPKYKTEEERIEARKQCQKKYYIQHRDYWRLYQREWERKNRSCAARGVKHSGRGLPACYADIPKIKKLVVKKCEPGKPFLITFD